MSSLKTLEIHERAETNSRTMIIKLLKYVIISKNVVLKEYNSLRQSIFTL